MLIRVIGLGDLIKNNLRVLSITAHPGTECLRLLDFAKRLRL